MFYKPTYCCHCGEKIENTENLPRLRSGRFCDACRREFPLPEWLPRIFILICAVFGLFGVGSYLESAESAKSAGLVKSRVSTAPAGQIGNERQADPVRGAGRTGNRENESEVDAGEVETTPEKRRDVSGAAEIERVYFCGAATKKGTSCSRKVKGGGRCWQHRGQEALIDEGKLLISK